MTTCASRMIRLLIIVFLLPTATAIRAANEDTRALVQTTPLRKQQIDRTITGYGVIVPDPASTLDINVPSPGQITRVQVSQGALVIKGDPLFELDTAPAARLEFGLAESNLTFAQSELQRVESMAIQQLATQSQVTAARKAVADARAALEAQRNVGSGQQRQTVAAPFAGVVSNLSARPGDRIQGGSTILQISPLGALQVSLGIQSEDAGRVRAGMPVTLDPVFGSGPALHATVVRVAGLMDPQTRLVDVVAVLTGNTADRWMPGVQVRGIIHAGTTTDWVVPRNAVLSDSHGAYIFQVIGGRSHRVEVHPGWETGDTVSISGRFDSKVQVVVLGNYELTDGMLVREAVQ